ncbi:hypothetical protein CLIB1444_04S00452 [[Candida] jaroonii]|uniref:Uncharacterized protein n=1 Tax=[Candida] jaroonii TaxID=467808 RepID=A0ACA9Y6T2_9ASCO|nr:hypothetical protein CLIB1444_04S00452 [[Candida] jaroonii]
MSEVEVVDLSDESDGEVQLLEIRNQTNDLINGTGHKITKKLGDIECPICFDEITNATTTSCGHIFCLECLQQSISSSTARGQTRRRGVGLCPLCRKHVQFKNSLVLRMKINKKVQPPSSDVNPELQPEMTPEIQPLGQNHDKKL